VKIVVAGAGLAGLAAATWLRARSHEVVVFEAGTRPGGQALIVHRPDSRDRVDAGPQYFHGNYRRALSLIEAAGLTPALRRVRGRTRFFDDRVASGSFTCGHRVPYFGAGSPLANLRLLLSGAVRLARNRIDPYALQDHARLDRTPVSEAVTAPFEDEFVSRAAIVIGALAEPGAMPVSYLHLIRLMWIISMTEYLTLDGGIASLHHALAEPLAVRYATAVAGIVRDGARVTGVVLEGGERVSADHVILAVPPHAAASILPAGWEQERSFLAGIRQPPAVIVTLFLDAPLEIGVWSYVFRPDPARLVSFCSDAARKNPAMVPSAKAALQAWICFPASERAIVMTDDELIARVLEELGADFPRIAHRVQHVHVHRIARALPQSPPGHNQAALGFLDALDRRAGIALCGNYLTGGYMECTLWSAERAVKRVGRPCT